jgi:hypothetical protein
VLLKRGVEGGCFLHWQDCEDWEDCKDCKDCEDWASGKYVWQTKRGITSAKTKISRVQLNSRNPCKHHTKLEITGVPLLLTCRMPQEEKRNKPTCGVGMLGASAKSDMSPEKPARSLENVQTK